MVDKNNKVVFDELKKLVVAIATEEQMKAEEKAKNRMGMWLQIN